VHLGGVSLEIAEHLGEVARVLVHAQHARAVFVHQAHAARPETLAGVAAGVAAGQAMRGVGVDQERFERIADLVAHVGVGQIETGQHDRLQLLLARYLSKHGQLN